MKNTQKLLPSLDCFKGNVRGQSGYAAMVGSVLMHFLSGHKPPPKDGWNNWKELFYIQASVAGLSELEASEFLNHICLVLVALGVIDAPNGAVSKDNIH